MSISSLLNVLSMPSKLILGISLAVITWAIFRYIIHLANNSIKESGLNKTDKRLSTREKERRLLDESQGK
jgi:hypothetical protein